MSEWRSYSLSDLLMFSPRVYDRLFELYNRDLWPAQLLTLALGCAVIYALIRRVEERERLVFFILGALWLWVAWGFLWERFAPINWPMIYVAPVFALQGFLLILAGGFGRKLALDPRPRFLDGAGLSLFAGAVALYPFLASLTGRPWLSAEIFGLAPDPTALATLALLALARGAFRWPLMVIPLLWCAISAVTLWTMDADAFAAPAPGAAAALLIAFAKAFIRTPDA